MPKVFIEPLGKHIEVPSDKSLLEVFREQGIYVKSSCGGHASCTDCVIKILEGKDNINAPSFDETKMIGNVFHITKERMACQTFVKEGDVRVDISMHDKGKDEQALKNKTGAIKRKKKDQVEKEREEKEKELETKNEEDLGWHSHWDKDKDPSKAKKLGGGRRPRPFRTDNLDEDKATPEELKNAPEFKNDRPKRDDRPQSNSDNKRKSFRKKD